MNDSCISMAKARVLLEYSVAVEVLKGVGRRLVAVGREVSG